MSLIAWFPFTNYQNNNKGLNKSIKFTKKGNPELKYGVNTFGYMQCASTEGLTFDNIDFSKLGNCSISFWCNVSASQTKWLPFSGQGEPYYIMASSASGSFYHKNSGGSITIYEDGNTVTSPGTLGIWHHYILTGVNLTSWTAFKFNSYNDSTWNADVKVSDIRIYDHLLSNDEIFNISRRLIAHYPLNNTLSTLNLLAGVTLNGHGSLWETLSNETYIGFPIYRNTVNNPNVGNNAGFTITGSLPYIAGTTKITISFMARLQLVYGKNFTGYIKALYNDGTYKSFRFSYNIADWTNNTNYIGIWQKITATVTLTNYDTIKNFSNLYVYIDKATGGICDYSMILVEGGPIATLYTTNNRTVNTLYDISGYNNNAPVTLAKPHFESTNAIRFKYSDDYAGLGVIVLPFGKDMEIANTSFSMWAYYEFSKLDSDSMRCLFYTTGYSSNRFYARLLKGSSAATFNVGFGSDTFSTPDLTQGWHHLAGTVDSNGTTLRMYVDGQLKVTHTESATFVLNSNILLGFKFIGNMSDVKFYKSTLSDADIKKIYNQDINNLGINMITGFAAGKNCSISNGVITTGNDGDVDTYFYLKLKYPMVLGKKYKISCNVAGLPEGAQWSFPIAAQSNYANGELMLLNGYSYLVFTANSTCSAASTSVIMDDYRTINMSTRAVTATFSNWMLEEQI